MRAIPFSLITLCSALQALLAFMWMKGGLARQLTDVIEALHGTLPRWTALAFSIGWFWLAVPLAGIAWLILAWPRKEYRRHAWAVAMVSLLGLVSMLYAMYPLHLILA